MSLRFSVWLSMMVLFVATVAAEDWEQWRGPNRDAKSNETGLLSVWPEDGPPLAWKTSGLGVGYSSVAIADGKIYTLGDLEDGCYVIKLSEADASPLWKKRIGDSGGHRRYPGPRSTPTVDAGFVFALSQHGDLVCLDANTGRQAWAVNLIDDFGGKMMSGWRYSESPLVDGDRVICTPGGSQGTVLALDRNSGEKIWQTSAWGEAAGYSSLIVATIDGVRQYVQLTGESVAGIAPDSGEVLWRADRPGRTAVVATPLVAGNLVFVTSSYGVGCNAFRVRRESERWTTEEVYASQDIANHHGGVVLIDGHVFGSSGGTFRCLELETGELKYTARSVGKGATAYADGHLYLRSENGPVALIEATPEAFREISRFTQPDRSNDRAWPHPVIANGKLYLRDQDILLCYDIRAK